MFANAFHLSSVGLASSQSVIGPQGPPGVDGAQGAQGPAGGRRSLVARAKSGVVPNGYGGFRGFFNVSQDSAAGTKTASGWEVIKYVNSSAIESPVANYYTVTDGGWFQLNEIGDYHVTVDLAISGVQQQYQLQITQQPYTPNSAATSGYSYPGTGADIIHGPFYNTANDGVNNHRIEAIVTTASPMDKITIQTSAVSGYSIYPTAPNQNVSDSSLITITKL